MASRWSLLLAAVLAVLCVVQAYGGPTPEDSRREVAAAYSKLLEVEELGYNVSRYVEMLNEALTLIRGVEEGRGSPEDLVVAQEIARSVLAEVPRLREVAEREKFLRDTATAAAVASIVAFAAFFAVYLPRALWRLWYRLRKDWLVKPV